MNRRAHQSGADGSAPGDQVAQLLRAEVADARPERDVRVTGLLRLHPHEALDHLRGGRVRALQQPLALEQRAIQRPRGENGFDQVS
jgi:hypothetical protein